MRRVLVIDDHEPSRRHLVRTLTESKYEIAGEGASGKLALTLARTAAPDVILMAARLAGIDGIPAARDLIPAHPPPPVLITRPTAPAVTPPGHPDRPAGVPLQP